MESEEINISKVISTGRRSIENSERRKNSDSYKICDALILN